MSTLHPAISDTTLRRRLILGSLGLAVAVSIIFIIVAYRLSSDLAESTEVNHFDKQFNWLFVEFERLSLINDDPNTLLANIKNNHAYQSMADNALAIEVMPERNTFDDGSIVVDSTILDKLLPLDLAYLFASSITA